MGCPTLFNPLALGEPLWSRGGMLKGNKGRGFREEGG